MLQLENRPRKHFQSIHQGQRGKREGGRVDDDAARLVDGSIWLSDSYVLEPSGGYRHDIVILPYRWVLLLAAIAIVGAIVFGRKKSN